MQEEEEEDIPNQSALTGEEQKILLPVCTGHR